MADWKKELDELLKQEQQRRKEREEAVRQQKEATEQNKQKAIEFVNAVVLPAFRELKKEFEDRSFNVRVEIGEQGTSPTIDVWKGEVVAENRSFQFTIDVAEDARGVAPQVEFTSAFRIAMNDIAMCRGMLTTEKITKDDIIRKFMEEYRKTPGVGT